MPDAIWYISGKPDNAGGPLQGSTYTWKPVYAGGLIVSIREGRQSGRPGDKHTVKYMEAGPGLRPCGIHLGTLCDAGGPLVEFTYTWKLVYAGGLIVYLREARQSGRPGDKYTVKYVEAGAGRRPYDIQMGSPTMREAH